MTGTRPQARAHPYATAGSSALAYSHSETLRQPVAPQQYRPQPRVRAPARRRVRRSIRAVTMLITLGVMFAVLCAMTINKQATASATQKQIIALENAIKKIQDDNRILELQLASATDGEVIRNYAVNTLGMARVRPEDIRWVSLPDTRPGAEPKVEQVQVQEIATQKGGFMSTLADLLRLIRI